MKSKKYYIDLINHTKIIKESETLNSDGEIMISLWLSPVEYGTNKMTINDLGKIVNDLAKTVNDLALEMREGFKQVNQRLDEHDVILKEHSEIFARNNLK